MKHIRTILAALALLSTATLSAQVTLDIKMGRKDTVTSSRHYVVAVTQAGNKATINGEQAKVYRTGAFGAALTLKEGKNNVKISVTDGKETAEETFTVVYDTKRKAAERQYTLKEAQKKLQEEEYRECLVNVETIEGAYLQYGDGGDRLGGNKMGYLEPGIVMKAVGTIRELYRVQLASDRFAYIPKEYVKPTFEEASAVNTGTMSVSNQGESDRIFLSLPARLPYSSTTTFDPTTISVDVYGAMNNSNWIMQQPDLGIIEYADAQQIGSDVFRIVIKLKEKYSWGYEIHYEGTNLAIEVKHSPENISLKGMTIGVDAGHGGPESLGAVSITGIHEADVNLAIVYNIKRILESKGANVVLSRTADYGIEMSERKKIFKDADIDLLVSIHNNAGGSPIKEMGTSTYYKYIVNRDLAKCLLDRMLELGIPCYGLTGNFNFSLNGPTEYPNALVECLFMSSLPDEDKIADPAFLDKIATKVVAGIEDYLKKADAARSALKKKK